MEKLLALLIATSLTSIAAVGIASEDIKTPFDSLASKEFAAQAGVSAPVYECAERVLADKDAEALVSFIETEANTAGTDAETPTAAALRKCVEMDPLGWYGTPYEEYIPLLLEYTNPDKEQND